MWGKVDVKSTQEYKLLAANYNAVSDAHQKLVDELARHGEKYLQEKAYAIMPKQPRAACLAEIMLLTSQAQKDKKAVDAVELYSKLFEKLREGENARA